jgi:hypothetical protein
VDLYAEGVRRGVAHVGIKAILCLGQVFRNIGGLNRNLIGRRTLYGRENFVFCLIQMCEITSLFIVL